MLRSAFLIFNPVAGRGDRETELTQIRQILEESFQLTVLVTDPETDVTQAAKNAIKEQYDILIASGGDGTVSAVAAALVNTAIPLGIIPRGTANAFSVALNIPNDIETACQTIIGDTTREVDVAVCNEKIMILTSGIGLGADVIQAADRDLKDRFGMLAYIFSGIDQFQNAELFDVEMQVDDQYAIQFSAVAITVANTAPATSILAQGPDQVIPDDGLLDITIVAPQSTLDAIAASYHLLISALKQEVASRPDIGYLRAKKVSIQTTPPQNVMVDGEMHGTTPLSVQCIPKGLTVIVPNVQQAEQNRQDNKLHGLPNLKVELIQDS